VEGPLDAGTPGSRDYDLILIDGAIPAVPQALIDQVRDGGRIGGAIVDRGVTRLFVGRKVGGAFGSRTVGDVGVPPLPGFAAPAEFQF
jgi:protein-L-isoaspartate(D-aspartate) O-methyltransferase